MWNWQSEKWPNFDYDKQLVIKLEEQFLQSSGILKGLLKHLSETDCQQLTVDLMSAEALKTSEIEGDFLSRESIKSSIRRNFGLPTDNRKIPPAEAGISEMMVDIYQKFDEPLTHDTLYTWHSMLTNGRRDLAEIGAYRSHVEPMEIVSGHENDLQVHFVAPPSHDVKREMDSFVDWFNKTHPDGEKPLPALIRASIGHLYFVCIHPFEDGNGRIGRALVEKTLAQHLGEPTLIALSIIIESYKSNYYQFLEDNNKGPEVSGWVKYFANTIIQAQQYSLSYADYQVQKNKLLGNFVDQLSDRQSSALRTILQKGPSIIDEGFSAETYIKVTETSRATATRDLQDLVSKQLLLKSGELKATRYFPAISPYHAS